MVASFMDISTQSNMPLMQLWSMDYNDSIHTFSVITKTNEKAYAAALAPVTFVTKAAMEVNVLSVPLNRATAFAL